MVLAASLLVLFVALLAIPFDITFNVQRREAFKSDINIVWLFGLVRFSIPGKSTSPPTTKPLKTKPAKKSKARKTGMAKNLLWNARFRYRLIKFVKDLFKSIQIAAFYLRVRLGLDDPADTGRLWALLGPLSIYLSNLSNATVSLEPEFQRETLIVDGNGEVRIVPLKIVFTILAFVLSPITIRAVFTASKSK